MWLLARSYFCPRGREQKENLISIFWCLWKQMNKYHQARSRPAASMKYSNMKILRLKSSAWAVISSHFDLWFSLQAASAPHPQSLWRSEVNMQVVKAQHDLSVQQDAATNQSKPGQEHFHFLSDCLVCKRQFSEKLFYFLWNTKLIASFSILPPTRDLLVTIETLQILNSLTHWETIMIWNEIKVLSDYNTFIDSVTSLIFVCFYLSADPESKPDVRNMFGFNRFEPRTDFMEFRIKPIEMFWR